MQSVGPMRDCSSADSLQSSLTLLGERTLSAASSMLQWSTSCKCVLNEDYKLSEKSLTALHMKTANTVLFKSIPIYLADTKYCTKALRE